MNKTTQHTLDQGRIDVIQQLNNFNPSNVLPCKSQDKGNRAREPEEIKLLVSPIDKFHPHLIEHSIEASARVLDHEIFEEERCLLPEYIGKKNIITLPKNGVHQDTPYNMHLTATFSYRGGLAPLQQQEGGRNIYERKTSHFIGQLNMNLSNLGVNIALRQPISQFGPDIDFNVGVDHPIYDLSTANFNDKTNDPNALIDFNGVFAAEGQDE